MKKTTLLSLILTVCIGYSAQSQDTLRLFGNQKKEQPKHRNKQTEPTKKTETSPSS